jgi:hypothetical protein
MLSISPWDQKVNLIEFELPGKVISEIPTEPAISLFRNSRVYKL